MILVDKITLLLVSDLSIMHFFILQYKNAVKIKKNQSELQIKVNQIGCIIVRVHGLESLLGQPNTIELVFVASPLSFQIIRIICMNGTTCLPVDSCFSELSL